MNFIVSATTDIGTTKTTNQDSLSVKVINTKQGRMVFAILCDGMGGLSKGEVASASVVRAFDQWVYESLPTLAEAPLQDYIIREQWTNIIAGQNALIKNYGARQGVRLGTTAVVMLLTQTRSFIMNVGDSRAYEFSSNVFQLTRDHTFVAREIEMGNMTPEQAETDERRSVLLQCVGASDDVYPDLFFDETHTGSVYMLCSDGFRHEVTAAELYEKLQPGVLLDSATMDRHAKELIELIKSRGERDNISVVLVRTF